MTDTNHSPTTDEQGRQNREPEREKTPETAKKPESSRDRLRETGTARAGNRIDWQRLADTLATAARQLTRDKKNQD